MKNQTTPNFKDHVGEEVAMAAVRALLEYIGEDPDREGLQDTPRRVVAALDFATQGYHLDPCKVLATTFAADGYDQMVLLRDVEFFSRCEHHMEPFHGLAHIAYVPNKRVVGLSKLARLVDMYAQRLQIQERMTAQVADALNKHLKPQGVAVAVEAKHFCMLCRGVEKQSSSMVTSALRGVFKTQAAARAEFFSMIGLQRK